jgi:hypothetical protein
MRRKPREGREECGNPVFVKTRFPHPPAKTFIWLAVAQGADESIVTSGCTKGSQPQHACWRHAERARTPSGKSRAERGIICSAVDHRILRLP